MEVEVFSSSGSVSMAVYAWITSSGSVSMAVSMMIGTAKKTIQFDILVFLETQEMNLRGNLQDSKCDILHIFLRTFLF